MMNAYFGRDEEEEEGDRSTRALPTVSAEALPGMLEAPEAGTGCGGDVTGGVTL